MPCGNRGSALLGLRRRQWQDGSSRRQEVPAEECCGAPRRSAGWRVQRFAGDRSRAGSRSRTHPVVCGRGSGQSAPMSYNATAARFRRRSSSCAPPLRSLVCPHLSMFMPPISPTPNGRSLNRHVLVGPDHGRARCDGDGRWLELVAADGYVLAWGSMGGRCGKRGRGSVQREDCGQRQSEDCHKRSPPQIFKAYRATSGGCRRLRLSYGSQSNGHHERLLWKLVGEKKRGGRHARLFASYGRTTINARLGDRRYRGSAPWSSHDRRGRLSGRGRAWRGLRRCAVLPP